MEARLQIEQIHQGNKFKFQPNPEDFLTPEAVTSMIRVPEINKQPHVLIFIGPTRSGTTATGAAMSQHRDITDVKFQPWKARIRFGDTMGTFTIPEKEFDRHTVFAKETYGPSQESELFDPIEMLINAGMSPSNITAITIVRDPIKSFASLNKFITNPDYEYYAKMQAHAIAMHHKWTNEGIRTVPFAYEMFAGRNELAVMKALLGKAGMDPEGISSLKFTEEQINAKVDWGEGDPFVNPVYYNEVIKPTLSKGEFRYIESNDYADTIDPRIAGYMQLHCVQQYVDFYQMSAHTFAS